MFSIIFRLHVYTSISWHGCCVIWQWSSEKKRGRNVCYPLRYSFPSSAIRIDIFESYVDNIYWSQAFFIFHKRSKIKPFFPHDSDTTHTLIHNIIIYQYLFARQREPTEKKLSSLHNLNNLSCYPCIASVSSYIYFFFSYALLWTHVFFIHWMCACDKHVIYIICIDFIRPNMSWNAKSIKNVVRLFLTSKHRFDAARQQC